MRTVFGLGLLILAMMVMAVLPGVSGQILPSFTWSTDSANKEVDVAPGSTGAVTFHCTLQVNTGSQIQVQVSLQAQAGGWGVTVAPPGFTCPNPEQDYTIPIDIVVIAPIGAPRENRNIIVTGTWQSGNGLVGDVQSLQLVAQVKPYYMMDVSSSNPNIQVNPGESVTFEIKITNQGNYEDRYKISIENQKDLTDAGWSVPTIGVVTIQSKEVKSVQIPLETPQDWTVWKNDLQVIRVRVSSEYSLEQTEIPVFFDFNLYCRQKGMYIPAFDPFVLISGLGIALVIVTYKRKW